MEILKKQWEKLKLTEEENEIISLDTNITGKILEEGNRSLVGKLLSERRMNKEVIQTTMRKIWRTGGSFEFHEIDENLFVITFGNRKDKDRVLEGKPWLFDNRLLVLKSFDGFVSPRLMHFDTEDFWVQMYNLPLACMNAEVGKRIGDSIGKVREVEVSANGIGWGQCLRAKIEIDLKRRLARGRTTSLLGEKIWIPLKYEKLPKLCFKCGVISHGEGGCVGTEGIESGGKGIEGQFGTWLRATYKPRRRMGDEWGQTVTKGGRGSEEGVVSQDEVVFNVILEQEGEGSKEKEGGIREGKNSGGKDYEENNIGRVEEGNVPEVFDHMPTRIETEIEGKEEGSRDQGGTGPKLQLMDSLIVPQAELDALREKGLDEALVTEGCGVKMMKGRWKRRARGAGNSVMTRF